jgi:hypothetical protein
VRRLAEYGTRIFEQECNMDRPSAFIAALCADAPAADRAEKLSLYGWLLGNWQMETTIFAADGTKQRGHGEIYFAWALQGRALQDVWILPGVFYGTTLRIYDPGIDAWHIIWSDPLRQFYTRQIGRARGPDIVQEGTDATGTPTRWTFTDITPNSFRWLGERSEDGGKTYWLQAEFLASRVST